MLSEISQAVKDKHHMISPNQQSKQASTIERHGNKEQSDSDQRGREFGIMRERRGRVKLRNMYKGHMDNDNGRGED